MVKNSKKFCKIYLSTFQFPANRQFLTILPHYVSLCEEFRIGYFEHFEISLLSLMLNTF